MFALGGEPLLYFVDPEDTRGDGLGGVDGLADVVLAGAHVLREHLSDVELEQGLLPLGGDAFRGEALAATRDAQQEDALRLLEAEVLRLQLEGPAAALEPHLQAVQAAHGALQGGVHLDVVEDAALADDLLLLAGDDLHGVHAPEAVPVLRETEGEVGLGVGQSKGGVDEVLLQVGVDVRVPPRHEVQAPRQVVLVREGDGLQGDVLVQLGGELREGGDEHQVLVAVLELHRELAQHLRHLPVGEELVEVLQDEDLRALVALADQAVADELQQAHGVLRALGFLMCDDVLQAAARLADVLHQPVHAVPGVELVTEVEADGADLLHDAVVFCGREVDQGEIRLQHGADFVIYGNLCHGLIV